MKKLYAKTSFSTKKSQKTKQMVDDLKENSIIFAYQNVEHAATDDVLYKSKQLQQHSNGYLDDPQYYYTINELEQLNMLDHRHPHYHRRHWLASQTANDVRMGNALRSNEVEGMPLHEHQKLVLQLPMVGVNKKTSMSGSGSSAYSSMNVSVASSISSPLHETSKRQHSNANVNGENDNNNMDSNSSTDTDVTGGFGGALPVVEALQRRQLNGTHTLPASTSSSSPTSLRSVLDASITLRKSIAIPLKSGFMQEHTSKSMPSIRNYLHDDSNGFDTVNSNEHEFLYEHRSHLIKYQQQQQLRAKRHNSMRERFINMNNGDNNVGYSVNDCGLPIDVQYTNMKNNAEQSIIGARASVVVYDDQQKKWVPSGSSSGLSKVQIYHHQQNNTFRVVGRKLQDHEVVINCSILKGLKYNQATATFHQWRDSRFVYGLNFSSQHDAEAFARAMMHALEVLSGRVANNPGQPTNGNGYEEDMGYRTMTSEDAAILRQQQQITGQVTPSVQTPTSQTNQNNIPQSPPTPQGHHRTSRNSLSAPPAPQPQQMSMPPQQQQQTLYAQASNGPTQNGMPASVAQLPPPAGPVGQYQHPVYATQSLMNAGYPQPNQYQQQTHYVLSNSNPNLNLHQYSQQQTVMPGAPPLPNGGAAGPIYVSSQAQLPTSASSNSVVYASQQQMSMQQQQPQLQTQLSQQSQPQQPQSQQQPPSQQQQQSNGPPASTNMYAQLNGVQSQSDNPYGQVPLAPQAMQPPPPPPPPFIGGPTFCPDDRRFPQKIDKTPGIGQENRTAFSGSLDGPQHITDDMESRHASRTAPPHSAAPPPPPPPPMGGANNLKTAKKDDPQADLMGSLAAQLQQAKLKKNKGSSVTAENSGSSTSSGGSGNYGTIGRSTSGMASMMDEMAKTLARRRAQAEKKEPEMDPEMKQRPWEKSNTLPHKLGSSSSSNSTSNNSNANMNSTSNNSGNESPRPMRKRFGSASEETILKVNGDSLSLALSSNDLDTLKAEIVKEMRTEIQKVKQEIIDAIKSEFNRR